MPDPTPTPSSPPDIMNDPAFAPPSRQDTLSSLNSLHGSSLNSDTCRICRSEGTLHEPLFYPCKCSGSIKFVHQECLMEWLSHSNKKHCELCKTAFRFTKLYDARMPDVLPWTVFVRRACVHVVMGAAGVARAAAVGCVWLGVIPWFVRWVWRWFFWIADAAWAREAFMQIMLGQASEGDKQVDGFGNAFTQFLSTSSSGLLDQGEGNEEPLTLKLAKMIFGFSTDVATANSNNTTAAASGAASFKWPQADPSILSSWTHLASLTPSSHLNRIILDIFEGQLITCVVITGFILVFLIREWVVQQQPLVNLDNLNVNFGQVQEQLREAAERIQADNERLARQQELLEDARRRLVDLQTETTGYADDLGSGASVPGMEGVEFIGWEGVEELIEEATQHLRNDGEEEYALFKARAADVTKQIRAANQAGVGIDDLTSKIYTKLSSFSSQERRKWEDVLLDELRKSANLSAVGTVDDEEQGESSGDGRRRPPMPERDFSSRATEIQRILTEADGEVRETEANLREGMQRIDEAESSSAGSLHVNVGSESFRSNESDGSVPRKRSFDPIPITNAGPDAKVNIRRSGKGALAAVPPPVPKVAKKMLDDDEAVSKLEAEVEKEMEDESNANQGTASSASVPSSPELRRGDGGTRQNSNNNNPFHPDGRMPPERRNSESFGNRVASVFREEFGLDEAEELEGMRRAEAQAEHAAADHPDGEVDVPTERRRDERPPTWVKRVADWFWGDIQPPTDGPEPAPAANEERQQDENLGDTAPQEAPFVPVQNGHPVVGDAAPVDPDPFEREPARHDPEVLAAAQEAGLDPEAIEDAEDLEGIFELIGLQGPIIGLFQTSAFCMLLVACTVLGAVIGPYIFGKLVLSFVGSPVYFMVKMPLQTASFIADFVIDFALMLSGWVIVVAAMAVDFLLVAAQTWAPSLEKFNFTDKIVAFAFGVAGQAGSRLQDLLTVTDVEPVEGLMWSWAFLGWSVHSHASLKNIGSEVDAVLSNTGAAITWTVETISAGSGFTVWKRAFATLRYFPALPAKLLASAHLLLDYTEPFLDFIKDLSHGALKISTPEVPLDDPSLVFWNSTDRALAILAGYTALAALAAIYVAADTPITTTENGRKTEKSIRDALRQAGGVLKVILIISIEMLVFPLYCGMLLDLAFLPLFADASVATRWAFAGRKPYTFCFVHWFVGTCYMFHFALFVGMCRKILRKGVLWFVRDPDDPTFHPVRDVLERNVATQLRKIAFSALVYGALVILCLGGVVWTIVQTCEGVFPIHWVSTEPVHGFPFNLFAFNFVTPLVFRLFKPTDAMSAMYGWWLRKCARGLRLSHFLFDDRRTDEEGHYTHRTWLAFLTKVAPRVDERNGAEGGVEFQRDGKYVLTPCNDQYRPPKPGEAFLHVDDDDVYIADREGKKNDHFAKVYVPPLFRLRVSLFMVCLWLFSAVTGLAATIVPLVLGRRILAKLMPGSEVVNDIYAYSVGAYLLAALIFVALKGRVGAAFVEKKVQAIDASVWIRRAKRFTARLMKCLYVYGFLGIVMPVVFALLLQFYLIMPLHTWASSALASNVATTTTEATTNASVASTISNLTALYDQATHPDPTVLADSTFHIFQGYALGLVYARIAMRLIITAPASRAAEAFRRITADGYTNPNIKLATRFFVLPASLLSVAILTLPPLAARLAISVLQRTYAPAWLADESVQTKVFRYSYPFAAAFVVLLLGAAELGKATSRWRASIRDEVYLVGERLHNFGEKKPPLGSKSVVRKERP